ncbi:hypothetical protein CVT25_002120 [Psilocybe cyanescens]|uniref:Uncharacterized protein n=1 Tax=Psilocybe cyanescens TaxID=93625 RepID=A0A409XCD2_PSICY|nr:hypothetical protein CVT25_002120 [Psilocybe cyanescens]
MSAGQQASTQQSSSAWTEPPWSGWIETTGDALLILEAARRGLIPRVTRRLVDSERKMITSGSVFVFDEDESGIKRWTDGFFWSPSRILGNFLLYRETDKRGAGHRSARAEQEMAEVPTYSVDGSRPDGQSLSRPKTDNTGMSVDKQRERTLMGSLTNSYKFKPDGLMKKTFSVTIGGVAQHLISYYKIEDVENGRLRSPSSLPELASLDISQEYLDKTHFRNPPKVERGVDGILRYRGEADDIENSPSILTAPLSSGMPLLTEGRITESSNKRGKRYEPYGSPPVAKRARRNTKSSQSDSTTPTAESASPQASASSTTPQPIPPPTPISSTPPIFSDPNIPPLNMAQPPPPAPYPAYGVPGFYQMPPGYPPPPPGHMYPGPPPPPHQVGVAFPHPPPPGAGSPQLPLHNGGPPQYAAYPGYMPPHPHPPHHPHPHPHPPAAAAAASAPALPSHHLHPSVAQVHGSDPSQAGAGAGGGGGGTQQPPAPPPPPSQPPHAQQQPPPVPPQPYYSYYPPPPPPGYGHVPYQWPVYSGYPPQPQPLPMPMSMLAQPVQHHQQQQQQQQQIPQPVQQQQHASTPTPTNGAGDAARDAAGSS